MPPLPLVLYLHGARQRGEDLSDLLRVSGTPPAMAATSSDTTWQRFVLVCPQTSARSWGSRLLRAQLLALVSELCARDLSLRLDPQRVYLCGASMGGDGVWTLASAQPSVFAALVPVCAAADLPAVPRLIGKPIWMFHGVRDTVVPVTASDAMASALRSASSTSRVRYSRLEDCPTPEGAPHAEAHAAWFAAFCEEEGVWDWLLEQTLPAQGGDVGMEYM